jgi:hypothetical protein
MLRLQHEPPAGLWMACAALVQMPHVAMQNPPVALVAALQVLLLPPGKTSNKETRLDVCATVAECCQSLADDMHTPAGGSLQGGFLQQHIECHLLPASKTFENEKRGCKCDCSRVLLVSPAHNCSPHGLQ